MKIKKLIAGLAASALACSVMATSAFAAEEHTAFLMCVDDTWCFGDSTTGNWNPNDGEAADGLGTDAKITGDGTYTVSFSAEQAGSSVPGLGVQVLCVDIRGLAADIGAGSAGVDTAVDGASKKQIAVDKGLIISDVTVKADDYEYAIPADKLLYGDIEGNGNIRIEIYNPGGGGETANPESAFYIEEFATALASAEYNEMSVTFTVSGLDGETATEPEAPADPEPEAPADPEPEAPAEPEAPSGTGLAGIALVGLALSGASVVATKKRK